MIHKLRSSRVAGPLLWLALALGFLVQQAIQVVHGRRVAWVGVAATLLVIAVQVDEMRRSTQPVAPPKEPPAWARSDSLIYGLLAAVAVALLTLALARPLVDGTVWIAIAKGGAAVGLALGLAWAALRGVTFLPLWAARLVGLAVAAAVIVGVLASAR